MRMMPKVTCATVLIAALLSAVDAHAQELSAAHGRRITYLSGSYLLWTTAGADEDPEGPGYLHPYFHGALDWPASGTLLSGGVFAGEHWSLGAELGLRLSRSNTFSEDERAKFETWRLSSLYTYRERLFSIVVQRHAGVTARVDLKPLGGLTISHTEQTLTDRHGTYSYPPFGVLPITRPDVLTSATRVGIVGGADLAFYTRADLAIVGGARLHWIARPTYTTYERPTPPAGPMVLQISIGARWDLLRR